MRYAFLFMGLTSGLSAGWCAHADVLPLFVKHTGAAMRALASTPVASVNPAPAGLATTPARDGVGHRTFASAKKLLPKVFSGLEEEFYCGCRYQGKQVDLASCGYVPRKNLDRALRIEWEHVVPAWVLGHQRLCWQQGGRKACTKTDPMYAQAEGDLVNLVPSVGELNGDRANYPYRLWTRAPSSMYGRCKTHVDFTHRRIQPREEIRGRIARITFYMYNTYRLSLSKQERQLLCSWAKQYPVDNWERVRDRRIVRWQGAGNPFVTHPDKVASFCHTAASVKRQSRLRE